MVHWTVNLFAPEWASLSVLPLGFAWQVLPLALVLVLEVLVLEGLVLEVLASEGIQLEGILWVEKEIAVEEAAKFLVYHRHCFRAQVPSLVGNYFDGSC